MQAQKGTCRFAEAFKKCLACEQLLQFITASKKKFENSRK